MAEPAFEPRQPGFRVQTQDETLPLWCLLFHLKGETTHSNNTKNKTKLLSAIGQLFV